MWKFKQNNITKPAHTARLELTLDTLYFDVWGDLVYTLQLAKVHRKEGIKIAMEDLIDHSMSPSRRSPIILMAHLRTRSTSFERVIETLTLYF